MRIKQITIQGTDGDVEIARTEGGALVTSGDKVLCEVLRNEDREARYAKAYEVGRTVFGQCRDSGPRGSGRIVPNATNSMIHDVLCEIERVAGC